MTVNHPPQAVSVQLRPAAFNRKKSNEIIINDDADTSSINMWLSFVTPVEGRTMNVPAVEEKEVQAYWCECSKCHHRIVIDFVEGQKFYDGTCIMCGDNTVEIMEIYDRSSTVVLR